MKTCSKCGGKHYGKGLCRKHYDALKYKTKKELCDARHAAFLKKNPGDTSKYRKANKEQFKNASAKWYANNREKALAYCKEYRERTKESRKEYGAKYRASKPEFIAFATKRWQQQNRARCRLVQIARKAAQLSATPKWAQSDYEQLVISEMYDLAALRTKHTGHKWHVDHIVPLRNKNVCGLHCAANLRVIPAMENHVKGNRVWPDMWTQIPTP